MEHLLIPCPKCGKELRLRDRSLLGRRGRCPKCEHRFVLEEPDDEVELELADDNPEPMVGTSARWIPDSDDTPPFQDSAPPPAEPQTAPEPASPTHVDFSDIATDSGTSSGVERLKEIRRRNARRRNVGIAIGGLLAVTIAGVIFAVQSQSSQGKNQTDAQRPRPEVDQARVAEREALQAKSAEFKQTSPTQGEPIDLRLIPAGARILFHFRPAELWQPGSLGEEFRYCLGPVGEWLETQLEELFQYPLSHVDRALIAVILGPRGTPPELAAVVRFAEEKKQSELLLKFGGERIEDYGTPVYLSGERAHLIRDRKTVAIAHRDRAGELVDSVQFPNPTSTGIEELIRQTDGDRMMTLIFEPLDVRIHQEYLVPENVRPMLNHVLDYFGDDVETVAWSLHLEPKFHSELLLRNKHLTTPDRLQREMLDKLDAAPRSILNAVQKMAPNKAGHRQIVGRFPAMMKVVSMATQTGTGNRYAQLMTVLPERAGPNLALGTLLTWDESTRTDFSRSAAPHRREPASRLPDKIADRMQIEIDVEFRRTPLREAFEFIGEEIQVQVNFDGDALKLSAYTQNMPQSFELTQVPAAQAFDEILKNYDKMCIVVDEENNSITVTTLPVAEQQGLTPYPLGAAR